MYPSSKALNSESDYRVREDGARQRIQPRVQLQVEQQVPQCAPAKPVSKRNVQPKQYWTERELQNQLQNKTSPMDLVPTAF